MIRGIISFITAFLAVITCYAQPAFYKHLEGKVGNNINIVLDMVVTGEKLGGYYYYFFDDKSGDDAWTHYGKSMPVYGQISSSNDFEFSEFDPEVKGAIFKGTLKDGIISGKWINADGKKQLPFTATETYPLGTMAFRVVYMNDKTLLTGKANSPVASLNLSLLLPVDYPVDHVADSVTAFVYEDFFEKASPVTDPAILFNETREQYFTNYKTSNADIYQEGAASFDWKKIKEMRILHNEHEILSTECYNYGFTGGAHGLSVSKFRVIDLKDGHQISLGEIFRENYDNDLRDIINFAARKKYNLERNQSLVEAGFFSEFIDAGPNFYITKDGIGFYYNQYEIAPFALGPIDIFVNYQELMRILNPETPVFRLISPN